MVVFWMVSYRRILGHMPTQCLEFLYIKPVWYSNLHEVVSLVVGSLGGMQSRTRREVVLLFILLSTKFHGSYSYDTAHSVPVPVRYHNLFGSACITCWILQCVLRDSSLTIEGARLYTQTSSTLYHTKYIAWEFSKVITNSMLVAL